jgi:hypothetical protein
VCLSQLEQIASILQGFATAVALGLGGGWSVWLFLKRRRRFPRATLQHLVTHRPIAEGKVLLHVAVRMCNIGEVLMSVVSSETRIQQVLPVVPATLANSIEQGDDPVRPGATEVEWPLIGCHERVYGKGDCEIEPGEAHDIIHDFILGSAPQTVEVYSFVANEKKRDRDLAWNLTTLYDLADPTSTHSLIPGGQG